MSTKHLNMYALDERTAESLTGLGKSRLETLEHHFLSQIKIKWYGSNTPPCPRVSSKQEKLSVQAVQGVIIHIGGGFQKLHQRVPSGSSVTKTALYGGQND